MLEHHNEPLASTSVFVQRMLLTFFACTCLILAALGIGILGYHFLARLDWIDSFLNASMILSSMGPVNTMPDDSAKLFSGCYALFSGLVFITSIGLLFTPIVHRLYHYFHLNGEAHL